MDYILGRLLTLPAIVLAISLHELAHGWVSYKLGDPTPRMTGRLSLNPLAHVDWVGAICLFFFGFGWAKPVQINPQYYKKKRLGMLMVSLAGVVMNLILAFISLVIYVLLAKFAAPHLPQTAEAVRLFQIFMMMMYYGVTINISLAIFNLIPIPPLDGSKVLFSLLPRKCGAFIARYEQYGTILLVVLLLTNLVDKIMTPGVNAIYHFFGQIIGLFL